MKKNCAAVAIILLLVICAVWNVFHIKALGADMSEQVNKAQSCCRREDFPGAEDALRRGLELWLDADGYTHVFIRHSEIDATSDAFYDALASISEQDGDGAVNACEKILYHIDSIVSMECVTFKSVF